MPGESHGQRSLAGCCPWSCRISVSQWAEDGGRGAAGPGRRGRSLLWQRRGRRRADTRGHTACPGLPLLSGHKEPLRREPVSLSCNEAAHALHTQGALHPYNSLTERLSILLQSFILLAQWISTIWGCGLLKERMKDTDRQISVYFRGLHRHTYTQPVSRCHTVLQLQTVSPIKTQSHMEKTS